MTEQLTFKPRHGFLLEYQERFVATSFLGDGHRKTLQRKAPGVWGADIFTPKYCELLLDEVEHILMFTKGRGLDSDGLPLVEFGFGPFFEQFTRQFENSFIRPVYRHHVLEFKTAFIVGYGEGSSSYHPAHEDESSLTVNLCLGRDFTGGDFCAAKNPLALRETLARLNELNRYGHHERIDTRALVKDVYERVQQTPYQALIHEGRHLHGAAALTSGSRINLVIWMTLSKPFPMFLQLPVELQSVVISHLPVTDILNMARVSKSIQALCDGDDVWEAVMARHPLPSPQELVLPVLSRRRYYGDDTTLDDDDDVIAAPSVGLSAKSRFHRLLQESCSKTLSKIIDHYSRPLLTKCIRRPGQPTRRFDYESYFVDRNLVRVVRVLSTQVPDNQLFPACPLSYTEEDVRKILDLYRNNAVVAPSTSIYQPNPAPPRMVPRPIMPVMKASSSGGSLGRLGAPGTKVRTAPPKAPLKRSVRPGDSN